MAEETDAPSAAEDDSHRRSVVRNALALGVPVGLYGLAVGAAAASSGLTPLQACVLSFVMFTGGSQFALIGVLGAGGAVGPAIGAALLLGARNTMYALRLAPMLRVRGLHRLLAAHGVIDETTAMATGQSNDQDGRLAFWVTYGSLFSFWNLTTLIGVVGADGLPETARVALDAVVPAAFLALLWPRLRHGADQRWTALLGAAIAVVGVLLFPPGVGVLTAVIAAVVVWLWPRRGTTS